jgi:acetyl esterase/lipase
MWRIIMRISHLIPTMLATLTFIAASIAQLPTPSAQPDAPVHTPEQTQRPLRRALENRPIPPDDRIPDSIEVVRDVVYATAATSSGETIELKLDAAFPSQSGGKALPAIVYIHGGGWRTGSKDMGLRPSIALALGGYFACTIQYRLTDQATYPAAVHDCKAAIRFLRANAEELGIDPERIGVWGHSAGGHLSALLGTSGNTSILDGTVGTLEMDKNISTAVQCVVDISGPTDLSKDANEGMISQWLGGPVRDNQDRAKQASPLTYVDAKDPPVLIIHGTEDRLVNIDRHARVFEAALKDAGVAVELLEVNGGGHAINERRAYRRAAEFFDQHLGGSAASAIERALGERERQRGRAGEPLPPGMPLPPEQK